MFGLPRAVWLLGWLSLFTDASSEAIYPLLPFFLTNVIGAGAVSLGVIEGAAEAVNSLLKILSGRRADRSQTKRPLILFGYGLSSAAKPFIALVTGPIQVFIVPQAPRPCQATTATTTPGPWSRSTWWSSRWRRAITCS